MKKIKKITRTETKFNIEPIKRILVVYLFLGFAWMMIFPNNFSGSEQVQIASTDKLLTFQFHGSADERGMSGQVNIHGAADKWSYLFDDTSSTSTNQTFTGTTNVTNLGNTSPVTGRKYARVIQGPITIENYYVAVETIVFKRDLAQYYLENYLEGPMSDLSNSIGINTITTIGNTAIKNCTTPRGEMVNHGDFIIAYDQRTDVDNICNVQKRFCNNGTLNGTYQGESCKENAAYAYDKIVPTSENDIKSSEYVQPTEPVNADATFSSQGKINETLEPNTVRNSQPANATIVTSKPVAQTVVKYPDCKTPRGEKVKNGQFVKAYLSSKGNITAPCDVELRMCVDGKLKGTYVNQKCTYSDVVLNKKTYKITQ